MIARTFTSLWVSICLMASASFASDIMVMDAFARASLTPTAKSAAAYVTLMNHGTKPDALLAITSDAAASADVHETTTVDGVMKMRPVARLDLAPNATVQLKPGGHHIMLTGLKAPLKAGDTLSLTLTFQTSGEMQIAVPVVALGNEPADSHDHEMGN